MHSDNIDLVVSGMDYLEREIENYFIFIVLITKAF